MLDKVNLNSKLKAIATVALMSTITFTQTSCAAMSTQIEHKDLNVESKMSNTIFLEPVPQNLQTVYLEVKNTSSESLVSLTTRIKERLRMGGWKVVNDPAQAHDLLQVNVLQFGEAKSPEDVWKSTNSGFGSVMTGALAGVTVGALTHSTEWGVGVGAGVAAASWIADQLVTNKTYSIITDLQVSVRNPDNKTWTKYNTRIASVANKVNLKFVEVKPLLVKQLSKEISGLLVANEE